LEAANRSVPYHHGPQKCIERDPPPTDAVRFDLPGRQRRGRRETPPGPKGPMRS